MSDILKSAKAYSQLLDVEYQILLGKKKKNILLSLYFEKIHFYHLAGLHYLKDLADTLKGDRDSVFDNILSEDITQAELENSLFYPIIKERIEYLAYLEEILDSNKTVFKYTPELEVFSKIQADFLLKNEMHSRNIFTFLSNEKSNGKYFCRTFFPQAEKDYSAKQTTLTLLYKKKIHKSSGEETVLYNRMRA